MFEEKKWIARVQNLCIYFFLKKVYEVHMPE